MKHTRYHTFSNEELLREADRNGATDLEVELAQRLGIILGVKVIPPDTPTTVSQLTFGGHW